MLLSSIKALASHSSMPLHAVAALVQLCCSSVAALLQRLRAACCGECRQVSTSMFTSIIYYRYDYIAPRVLCCSSVAALLQAYPVSTRMFYSYIFTTGTTTSRQKCSLRTQAWSGERRQVHYIYIFTTMIYSLLYLLLHEYLLLLWRTPPGLNIYIFTTILYSLLYLLLHEYLLPYCGERR